MLDNDMIEFTDGIVLVTKVKLSKSEGITKDLGQFSHQSAHIYEVAFLLGKNFVISTMLLVTICPNPHFLRPLNYFDKISMTLG